MVSHKWQLVIDVIRIVHKPMSVTPSNCRWWILHVLCKSASLNTKYSVVLVRALILLHWSPVYAPILARKGWRAAGHAPSGILSIGLVFCLGYVNVIVVFVLVVSIPQLVSHFGVENPESGLGSVATCTDKESCSPDKKSCSPVLCRFLGDPRDTFGLWKIHHSERDGCMPPIPPIK